MLNIIKHQLIDGIRDSKYLFMAAIVLLAFIANAFIFGERYKLAMDDWRQNVAETTNQLHMRTENLQQISVYPQRLVKPPSALAFVADGGEDRLPNRIVVNGFVYRNPSPVSRGNDIGMRWKSLLRLQVKTASSFTRTHIKGSLPHWLDNCGQGIKNISGISRRDTYNNSKLPINGKPERRFAI